MFQASHLARPLKSNIPGRSVDVQRQGEGFFLCFNASQKNCNVVALPTSGEKQKHLTCVYYAVPVRPHFFWTLPYSALSLHSLRNYFFSLTIGSAESGTGSAQGLTHVDVSDCGLLVQGVELAQFRVVRVLLQHLDLLRCFQEWFLLGWQQRSAACHLPTVATRPGTLKARVPRSARKNTRSCKHTSKMTPQWPLAV